MTLRHRLLLVYGIVVLLSVATVGMSVFETSHARQIIRELQDWNGIVLQVEKLKSEWFRAFAPEDKPDLKQMLAEQFLVLAEAPDYLDKQRVLEALREVYRRYDEWKSGPSPGPLDMTDNITTALQRLSLVVAAELEKLNGEADRQAARTQVLLVSAVALTILHIAVVASLLKRWLLQPMEQLNRQVDALARDEAPREPLLQQPQELANLAAALDRARESLRALRVQLIESERLTTIGQLAAQLAHNLRNPLASIRATAQVTGRAQDAGSGTHDRMQQIVASVDRLNNWIAGLMEVARREPTATTARDVVPLLHRIRESLLTELAAKELTLDIQAAAEGLVCAHDPATLEHALVAMVVNAIEASPLGGRIRIAAERLSNGDGRVFCRISVQDEGTGLPADAPERIFEFSYSTKQRGMGLGLGLARQALQRQGGVTGAMNNPDVGATVYVELPETPSPAA